MTAAHNFRFLHHVYRLVTVNSFFTFTMPSSPPRLGSRPKSDLPPPRLPDVRPDSTSRGYSYRWKKHAKAFLAAYPLCCHCERQGRSTLATLVDHIIPVSTAGESDPNFYLITNHQPLCRRCHARKTAIDIRKGLTR